GLVLGAGLRCPERRCAWLGFPMSPASRNKPTRTTIENLTVIVAVRFMSCRWALLSSRFRFREITDRSTNDSVLLGAGGEHQRYFGSVVFVRRSVHLNGLRALPNDFIPLDMNRRNARHVVGPGTQIIEEPYAVFICDCGPEPVILGDGRFN